jgi:hypothetical protein
MSTRLTLLKLLGVSTAAEAAETWPRETFLPDRGLVAGGDDPQDYEPLLAYLDQVLSFHAVRPGAAAERVGLTAEVVVADHPTPRPIVMRRLPDIAFTLLPNTIAAPARLFVTQSDAGVEVIVEGLAVEISLPNGLLLPLRPEAEESAGPALTDVVQGAAFSAGAYDGLQIFLSELAESRIRVHLRVRFTEEQEVVIEPAVPISVGPCRFGGLPCAGVHDLGFLPYPVLSGDHTPDEMALEWARHEIPTGLGMEGTGLVTVRTLDLDHTRDPLKQFLARAKRSATNPSGTGPEVADLEFVLEDLALPVSAWLTPVATHGRFGLRRKVLIGGDEVEAYDLTQAPLEISLAAVVDWRLRIFRLLFESPSTVVARMAVLFGDSVEEDHALVIDVTDGWLLQGAWLPPDPLHFATVAGARFHLMTVKLGILLRDLQEAQGAEGWLAHLRGVFDIGIAVGEDEGPFTLSGPAKPPGSDLGMDVVVRDLGWDLGSLSVPALWLPEDLSFTAFKVIQLDLEEVVFLSEPSGGRYVGFSGGISIFPGAGDPEKKHVETGTPGVPAEGQPDGAGLRFRRLRFRIGGDESAPRWLIDGVSLFLRIGSLEVMGSGTISDTNRDGHRYEEFGLGLLLRFSAMDKDFSIGAQLFYGRVSGPVDRFTYWLFGLQLAYCPAGSFDLRGISVLVAGGMMPNLPAPSGKPQEMRLLDWYRQNRAAGAVEIRDDRAPQRGGWKVEQGAEAAGVGADLGLSVSRSVTLRVFMFFHRSDEASGLLISAEVFLLKARTPVGFGAIEVDLERDRYSALVGVDLDFAALLDSDSALAKGLGRMTGTIFAGNQPAMFAIGQLADQASWLTFSVNKSFLGLTARIALGVCLQISARPGPRGFGFFATATAQGSMGIGKVQFYAALGLIVGTWGNEASSSGVVVWAEVALRIKVFWVFSFGASVKAAIEQLGPQEPNYRRIGLEVRIETPWWLPDVTFRVEKVRSTPQPEAMPVVSPPLSGATAREPGLTTETLVAFTALGEPGAVHSIAELRLLPSGPIPDDVWDTLTPVSVDSVLALDFAASLGNETTIAPSVPFGTGTQAPTPPAQNNLSASYTLVAIGVRRRPRFGTGAGVWTDLLAPEDSQVAALAALVDPSLTVSFDSVLRVRWDADVVVDDTVDPRRLLVNADTPFSFVTANPGTEEGLLAQDPSYPCCSGKRTYPPHVLDFAGIALGTRAPDVQRFTNSASRLRWQLPRPPVVCASQGPQAGDPVGRIEPHSGTDRTIAVVTFDEPVHTADLQVFWHGDQVGHLDSALVVEATRGLEVVVREVLPLGAGGPTAPIHVADPGGLTSLTLRYLRTGNGPVVPGIATGESFELRRIRYRTVREARDFIADQGRCGAGGGVAGAGKLAWLPNHDYEVTVRVRTSVDYQGSVQDAVLEQRAGFRTRGLPGLNAVAAVGQELEPYVESVYPGAAPRLLYRSEPAILAFDERFNSLLPVDRTPSPTDPSERTQLLEWVLAVDLADSTRLSVTSTDWVVDHRGTVPPPQRLPRIIDDVLVRPRVRSAASLHPTTLRLEALASSSPACGPATGLHNSQVLSHQPVDPDAPDAPDPRWPARATMRMAVRRKAAPFVARSPFEADDLTALTVADEGRTGATGWVLEDGALRVAGAPPVGIRHYAAFGDSTWDHVRVSLTVDPAGGAAGIAVAVRGLPRVDRALIVVVDAAAGELRIIARRGGASTTVAAAPLPQSAGAPVSLEVLAFDDTLRARVGDVTVDAPRADLRDGRLAIVLDGAGSCAALRVDGLDAYTSLFATSRYAGFEEHVGSWDGVVRPSPGQAGPIPGLLTETAALVPELMTPTADPQARQRLFDRWVADLVLPLTSTTDGVRISSVADGAGTRMLLLESPEPLPFSRDVTLVVTHRVRTIPGPPPAGVPRSMLRFAADLAFTRDAVSGTIPSDVVGVIRAARTLVLSTREGALGRIVYRIYDVTVRTGPRRSELVGELREVRNAPPGSPTFPRRPRRFPADHIGLFDAQDEVIGALLPLPVERDEVVPLVVLSNSSEDRVLLIPLTPFASDLFTFSFAVDRERYRSAGADAEARYRRSATLRVAL